jgi:hypothetical protein
MESTSINQCECQGGSYHKLARVGEPCEECPHGMYCQGAQVHLCLHVMIVMYLCVKDRIG